MVCLCSFLCMRFLRYGLSPATGTPIANSLFALAARPTHPECWLKIREFVQVYRPAVQVTILNSAFVFRTTVRPQRRPMFRQR